MVSGMLDNDERLDHGGFACHGKESRSGISPILSSIYLSPVMWAFHTEQPDTQLISYVNDGMIIVMSKSIEINLVKLQAAYSTVYQLTRAMGLVLEHDKSEVFHFSRNSVDAFVPVDLGYAPYTGDTPLVPKHLSPFHGACKDVCHQIVLCSDGNSIPGQLQLWVTP